MPHCAAAACVAAVPLVVSLLGSCEPCSGVLLPALPPPPPLCCSSCHRWAVASRAVVCSCLHHHHHHNAHCVAIVWLPPSWQVPLGCACTHNLMSEKKEKKKLQLTID